MFTILDGRSEFYQWDLNRKLIVNDKSIAQVHFCNRTDDCSLVRYPYEIEGLYIVDVPNVLLQTDWRISVYGYDKDFTKHSAKFDVVRRTKPETYVYTDEETSNYNDLLERVNAIEKDIEQSVKDYLEENPVEVDLEGYATEQYVKDAVGAIDIPEVDLKPYALKTDIPDTSAFITMEDVEGKGYQTAEDVQALIPDIPEIPDTSNFITMAQVEEKGYQTEAQVSALISEALGVIENGTY